MNLELDRVRVTAQSRRISAQWSIEAPISLRFPADEERSLAFELAVVRMVGYIGTAEENWSRYKKAVPPEYFPGPYPLPREVKT